MAHIGQEFGHCRIRLKSFLRAVGLFHQLAFGLAQFGNVGEGHADRDDRVIFIGDRELLHKEAFCTSVFQRGIDFARNRCPPSDHLFIMPVEGFLFDAS